MIIINPPEVDPDPQGIGNDRPGIVGGLDRQGVKPGVLDQGVPVGSQRCGEPGSQVVNFGCYCPYPVGPMPARI